ncbi:class I SAM-dependent methyltransferase [Candidatus Margulisiibacteriota bacterium]
MLNTPNIKFCIPSFLERYSSVLKAVKKHFPQKNSTLLDLGCGEGDYSFALAKDFKVIGLDANPDDIKYNRFFKNKRGVKTLDFICKDALHTGFGDATFDYILCVDVIEHVPDPKGLLLEAKRLLKKGGRLLFSFPSLDYPFIYDPINKLRSKMKKPNFSLGAYGYGHEKLIDPEDIDNILTELSLKVIKKKRLSFHLVGFLEIYWASILQKILKRNAANIDKKDKKDIVLKKVIKLRSFIKLLLSPVIFLVYLLVKIINTLDRIIFFKRKHSIGLMIVVEKE